MAGGDCTFEVVQPFLDQLLAGSGYVVCPGITEYPSVICFKTKKLRERGLPFKRVDSKMCSLWHLPNNVNHPHGSQLRDLCVACRRLSHDIRQLVQRATSPSKCRKESRVHANSNYPLKYLSPTSKATRGDEILGEDRSMATRCCYNMKRIRPNLVCICTVVPA